MRLGINASWRQGTAIAPISCVVLASTTSLESESGFLIFLNRAMSLNSPSALICVRQGKCN